MNRIKKKMVICGATGIDNSGDEAILDVILLQYQKLFDITVISINLNTAYKYHANVNFVKLSDKKTCIRKVKGCDVFLLGGGGLFQDETSVFNIMRWAQIASIGIKYSKHAIVYANSIGPLNHKFSRFICRKVLNKMDFIILRDSTSYGVVQKLGINVPTGVTADPVFSYPIHSDTKKDATVCKLPSKYVAVSIRHWYDSIPLLPVKISNKLNMHTKKYNNYIATLREITTYINKEFQMPVVFISFMPERDKAVAKKVLNTKYLNERNYIVENSSKVILPEDFMKIIDKAEFLVGMRLHSLIYSIDVHTPFIAIDYSDKVNGLLKDLEMTEYGIPIEKLSMDIFKQKCQLLVENKKIIVSKLIDKSTEMREREKRNKHLVLHVLEEGKKYV